MLNTRAPETYQYLPLYTKLAIERLDADYTLRNAAMLNHLLDAYAEQYRETCDEHIRMSVRYRATRRFGNTFAD
jgi:hypothetical protein